MFSLAKLRSRAQQETIAAVSPIGLEFGETQANFVQLSYSPTPSIRAFTSVPYPVDRTELLASGTALATFVRNAVRSGGFRGKKVFMSLPSVDVRILSVTYQVKANENDDIALEKLLEERIGEDLSQFVIDYVPIRTESRESDRLALVLLSEQSTVVSRLEALRRAGLEVLALEVSPVAIKRLVSSMISAGEVPQNVLVINTGTRQTFLTMISGQRLLFDQEIEFGEASLLEEIATALDAPTDVTRELVFRHGLNPKTAKEETLDAEMGSHVHNTVLTIAKPQFGKLVNEIRRTILFASSETRGGEIGHAFLLGSVARWPGVPELLSELSGIPVSLPAPLPYSDELRSVGDELHPELAIAAGLALRGNGTDA